MEEYKIFSNRLKEAMKKKHRMKQSELAEATGLTEVTISRYINGYRVPKATELVRISKAVGVSCDYLLGNDEYMSGKIRDTIRIDMVMSYCEKSAEKWADFGQKALENIGHGDSHTSTFGAVAYAAQQEEMYKYRIPDVIRKLSSLN